MTSAFACGAQAPTRLQSASRCGIAVLIRRPSFCNADMDSRSERRAAACTRSGTLGLGDSHRQHNLSEMFVLAHVRLRRRGLVERKAAVDRQSELARGHRLPQIGAHAAANLTHFLERA